MKNNVTELKKISVAKIGLPIYLVDILASKGITILEDLINLSINDLAKLLVNKEKSIDYIVNAVTKLELEFSKIDTIKPKITLDSPIEDLYLPARSYNALYRSRILTIKDLISVSRSDLLTIRNLGNSSVNDIIIILKDHGFDFENKDEIKNINLDSSIFALDISLAIREGIAKNGIKTIRELIQLSTKELKRLIYSPKDVIDYIHSLDFYFADEQNLINNEQDNTLSIRVNTLENENNDIKFRIYTKNHLLDMCQKLISEKEYLLKQEQELDLKIEDAMERLNKLCGDKYAKIKK